MRKKEKEINEKSDIESVIRQAVVCRLGLSDNNIPYIVPMCFGYMDDTIYLHSSYKGMKADIIRKNPNICFEIDTDVELVEAQKACDYGMKYRSVIGFGKASFIEDEVEKKDALAIIMSQYSDREFQFPEEIIGKTAIIKIDILSMIGKQSGFFES